MNGQDERGCNLKKIDRVKVLEETRRANKVLKKDRQCYGNKPITKGCRFVCGSEVGVNNNKGRGILNHGGRGELKEVLSDYKKILAY